MNEYEFDIIGTIGEDFTVLNLKEHLKEAAGADIVINLDSPGGSVFDGISQYNTLKEYSGNIAVKINSLAASAASYFPLAADKVIAHQNSTVMIHNVWSFTWGDHSALRKEADQNEALTKVISKLYAAKTGKTEEELLQFMNDETWMYGDEILDFGIADEIIPISGNASTKAATLQDSKLKFAMMKNSIDKEKYNEELKRVVNIVPKLENTGSKNPGKNNKGAKAVNKKEILAELNVLMTNNKITLPEIAEGLDLSDQVVGKEHKDALNFIKKINKLAGDTPALDYVQNLIDENEAFKKDQKKNAADIRETRILKAFGPEKDEVTKKENSLRTFADTLLKGKEATDEEIEEVKSNSIYKSLLGNRADLHSPENTITGVSDNDAINADANNGVRVKKM